jgi:hypothetical protein
MADDGIDLDDLTIALLSDGTQWAVEHSSSLTQARALRLYRNPRVQERAKKIILHNLLNIVRHGKWPDNDLMLYVIEGWVLQEIVRTGNKRPRGRRRNITAEAAVVLAYENLLRQNPEMKREAAIAQIREEFKLGRSRLFEIFGDWDIAKSG